LIKIPTKKSSNVSNHKIKRNFKKNYFGIVGNRSIGVVPELNPTPWLTSLYLGGCGWLGTLQRLGRLHLVEIARTLADASIAAVIDQRTGQLRRLVSKELMGI